MDGLRGIAILLVLVAHMSDPNANRFDGAGNVGVTLFFALSGFLITALLLQEHADTGRVSLRGFYRRRFFRIAPALIVTIAVVFVVDRLWTSLPVHDGVMLSALFSASNWWLAAHAGHLGGLAQTWSLGIEEQFYAVWPVLCLFGLRWGRRGVGWVAGVGSVVSLLVVVSPLGVTYYGSLSRAWCLLAGCLLAVWLHGRREVRPPRWVAPAASVGLLPFVPVALGLPIEAAVVCVPAVSMALLWASATGSGPGWLSVRWLRWLGQRSYGLYLIHYPVLWAVPASDPWWVRSVLALVLSLALTEVSYRRLERPLRRRGMPHQRKTKQSPKYAPSTSSATPT